MALIVVTGVAGFIGSNIAQNLLKDGHQVIGVDNFSTGKKENISSFADKIDLREVDVRDVDALKKCFEGADFVLHHAALPSVPYSVDNPEETNEVNAQGTFNVLMAAKDAGVKKVVFASSAAVYGDTVKIPIEEGQELNPLSPYAAQKIVGEFYCKLFYNAYGLRTTSLRYFNVYGLRQDPNSQYAAVVPKFISLLKHGKNPVIFGDGLQTRDFVSVDDVYKANMLALKHQKSDGKIYNIASGKKTSVLDLVNTMNELLGTNLKPIFEPPRAGDVKHSVASVALAKKDLNFSADDDLEQGLKVLL